MRSIRARTTALAVAVATVALCAGAAALVLLLGSSMRASSDDLARARITDVRELVRDGALPRVLPGIGDDSVAQVVTDDGRVVASSANVTGRPRFATFRPTGAPEVREQRGPDDQETEDYRLWAQRATGPGGAVTIYVGTSLEAVHEVTGRLTRLLLVGVPLAVLLVGLGTWLLVGRALRPVERMRAEVAEISALALDRRVPVPAARDELSRLATTMNTMLDRLEDASSRQREFVANASHDLKSPLTVVRAELEVAARHPEATDWPELVGVVRRETDRMERLVQDLLFLARSDEGARRVEHGLVDLDDVVLEEVARMPDPVRVDTRGVSAAPVRGSRDDLARLVRNLLANAAAHATHGVVVTTSVTGDGVELRVEDDGPGIPAEERERVFERFVRLDEARSADRGGTGLGLAIVRSVAEAHGGSVAVAADGPGARLVVRLPLALASAGSEPRQTEPWRTS